MHYVRLKVAACDDQRNQWPLTRQARRREDNDDDDQSMGSVPAVRPTPASITLGQFQDALGRYEQLIEAVSASKASQSIETCPPLSFVETDALPAKPGQKTLAELDHYRYTEAPALFPLGKPSRNMQLEDVKNLVEWKLQVPTLKGGVFVSQNAGPASSSS